MNDYRILQGVWVAQCMLGSVKLSVNSIFARIGKQKQKQARLNRIILGGGGALHIDQGAIASCFTALWCIYLPPTSMIRAGFISCEHS